MTIITELRKEAAALLALATLLERRQSTPKPLETRPVVVDMEILRGM